MSDDTPSRISVSRDALRAELAEMELRLRIYFDEQLKHKASSVALAELALKVSAHERGEFTPAWKEAVRSIAEEEARTRSADSWLPKGRVATVMAAVGGFGYFILAIYLAVGGSH